MSFYLDQGMALLAILYVAYTTYIYNRKSVSLSLPALLGSGVSTSTAGLVVSSQNLAYTFSKLLAGIASDHVSPRKLLASGLFSCAATTLLFAQTGWETGYIVLWFLNGVAQGFGWSSCAKIIQTASPSRLGTLWSIMSTSANLAGILSPILSAVLIHSVGWRWNLLIVSVVTALVGILCLTTIEQVDLSGSSSASKASSTGDFSFWHVFWKPTLLLLSLYYFVVSLVKTALSDWSQVLLISKYHLHEDTGSRFVSSLEFGGFCGSLIVGYITDRFIASSHSKQHEKVGPVHTRMVCALLCACIQCIFMHLFCFDYGMTSSEAFRLLLGTIIGACIYGQIVLYGIMASEMVPSHLSGTSHSIVSMAANVGAVVAGYPLASLARRYDWKIAFVVLECVGIFVAVVMLLCVNLFRTKTKAA